MEYQFRGKPIYENYVTNRESEYVYGGYCADDDENSEVAYITNFNITELGFIDYTCVHKNSVGQYIGINDKNGVKTFSSDKIRIGGIEAKIIFKNGAFRAKSEFGEYTFDDIFNFEVIGGI